MEADIVRRAGLPFRAIPAAGVHGVWLRRLPGNAWKLTRGIAAARRVLRAFQPDVLFFTGGYVAFPMALAGWRIPTLLYVPDIEPGLALKSIARLADRIALTAEDSRRFFGGTADFLVSGYPVRTTLTQWTRESARQALQLADDAPVLLFFGGSKGARSINKAVLRHLEGLLDLAQVVHISGRLDWEEVQAAQRSLPAAAAARYHAFPYLHEKMGAALAAADLVVSRSGASTLGEFPAFGLPAILVPYPYAWRYQKVNADYLTSRGAAILLEDADLWGKLLLTVQALLADPLRLKAMRENMQALYQPEAAARIGAALLDLGERKHS